MATNGSTIAAFCKVASCLADLPSDTQQPHVTSVDDTDAQAVELAMAENSAASWGRLIVHQDLQRKTSDSTSMASLSAKNPVEGSRLQPLEWAHSVAYGDGRPRSYY